MTPPKRRRRAGLVGMPRKTSTLEKRFNSDASYRFLREFVFDTMQKGLVKVERFFKKHGWFEAEFAEYYPRSDEVELWYPADDDSECCSFLDFMHASGTRMTLRNVHTSAS